MRTLYVVFCQARTFEWHWVDWFDKKDKALAFIEEQIKYNKDCSNFFFTCNGCSYYKIEEVYTND